MDGMACTLADIPRGQYMSTTSQLIIRHKMWARVPLCFSGASFDIGQVVWLPEDIEGYLADSSTNHQYSLYQKLPICMC